MDAPPIRSSDRLSSLPDEILLEILSFLPVKSSASLSVLSRRLHRLVSLLPCHDLLLVDSPTTPFPDAAFLDLCEIPILHLLSAAQLLPLLLSAADRGVRRLHLQNNTLYNSLQLPHVAIPNFIFEIKSLQALSITNCRVSTPSSPVKCTDLTALELRYSLIDDFVIQHLALACSQLESLCLFDCVGSPRVSISSNSLKDLTLMPSSSVRAVEVTAPSLINLTLYTDSEVEELKIEAPNVRRASLRFWHKEDKVPSFFQGFLLQATKLRSLVLAGCSMELISKERGMLERLNTSFKKLRILSACLDFTSEQQVLFLVKLLECCPRLVALCLSPMSTFDMQIPPSAVEGTGLRTLELQESSINDFVIDHLAFACPHLENLNIDNCIGCPRVLIFSDRLKHLWLKSSTSVKVIDINAPRLTELSLYTYSELWELKIKAPEVRQAFLHLSHDEDKIPSVFQMFLSQATKLCALTLDGSSVQLLSKECAKLERLCTLFKKMMILSVSLDITSEQQVLFLVKLLECCPRLGQLCVSICKSDNGSPEASFEGLTDRMKRLKCIARRRLVDVELHGFEAGLNDQEFVRILLSGVKSMKKMTLQFPSEHSNAVKDMLSVMNHPAEITSHHRKLCSVVLEFKLF